MFQLFGMLCLTLKTAAPFQSCVQSGIIECCVATNCQLNCQSMAVKFHGQQTLLSYKCKMLKSCLEHLHLSTIPETAVAFLSSWWRDARAGQERLPGSHPLFPEDFQTPPASPKGKVHGDCSHCLLLLVSLVQAVS